MSPLLPKFYNPYPSYSRSIVMRSKIIGSTCPNNMHINITNGNQALYKDSSHYNKPYDKCSQNFVTVRLKWGKYTVRIEDHKLTAGGTASMSVAPSPTTTSVLWPRSFLMIPATTDLPPEEEVGWVSSNPAKSPVKCQPLSHYRRVVKNRHLLETLSPNDCPKISVMYITIEVKSQSVGVHVFGWNVECYGRRFDDASETSRHQVHLLLPGVELGY
jgi:hypothetical protein